MKQELQDVINQSTFTVQEGKFVYIKSAEVPANVKDHFMVSVDRDEVTVVTTQELESTVSVIEKNKDTYCLIALNVSVPFYCVGFLAEVTRAVADAGLNILVISTYSKDYIMVEYSTVETAKTLLLSLGFAQR